MPLLPPTLFSSISIPLTSIPNHQNSTPFYPHPHATLPLYQFQDDYDIFQLKNNSLTPHHPIQHDLIHLADNSF